MKTFAILGLAAMLSGGGFAGWQAVQPAPLDGPVTVTLPAEDYQWRPSGDWQQGGRVIDPPLVRRSGEVLAIMKYQVTVGQYRLCVADGACTESATGQDLEPQVMINWYDAEAYARWLSRRTGQTWRLPTEEEWQRAAAERFVDDVVGEAADPGARMLAAYERNRAGRIGREQPLRVAGGFGENSLGIGDLAGNVWEWTSTCVITGEVTEDGGLRELDEYCGARIVAGQHRARVVEFVRDARAGGCGSGVPPDFLGFRLVRDGTTQTRFTVR